MMDEIDSKLFRANKFTRHHGKFIFEQNVNKKFMYHMDQAEQRRKRNLLELDQ